MRLTFAYLYLWLRRRYGCLGNAQINLAFRSAYPYLCPGKLRGGAAGNETKNDEREAVLVSCGDADGERNLLTVAWTGTVCTDPAMCYISVRPERHSYGIIRRTGEFVINLTTRRLARATDWCGVRSGRDYDKFAEMGLTAAPALEVSAPVVDEAPVNIECRVRQVIPLGSHDMFLAEVVAVQADSELIDPATGRFCLERADLLAYAHGEYFTLGEAIGKFGWSVRRKKRAQR